MENTAKRILISGAGISGLVLAYWLKRHGFEPVLAERSYGPRDSADITHVMGAGYDVLERMGMAGRLRGLGLDLKDIEYVDSANRTLGRTPLFAVREHMDNRICHVPRADLERLLLEALGGGVEIRYGSSIRRLDRNPGSVSVLFEDHDWEPFDLVIGADGFHSNVRRQAFGWDDRFERFCGYHFACFTEPGLAMEERILCHAGPSGLAGRIGLGKRAAGFFLFGGMPHTGIGEGDVRAQKRQVRLLFQDMGWECPALLEAMDAAGDFRCMPVSQIRMPSWCQKRVALVGDAAYCPSLFCGQGANLALAGAYILAGELKASEGEPSAAFGAYEKKLRSWVLGKQDALFSLPFSGLGKLGSWLNLRAVSALGHPLLAKTVVARRLRDEVELRPY